MAGLDFTNEDLEANREGHLTEGQRARLRRALLRDTILYGLLALLLGGFIVLLAVTSENPFNGVLIVMLVLLIALIYSIIKLYVSTRADLAGMVKVAAGQAALYDSGRGLRSLIIGQQNFQVSKAIYLEFTDGKFYRVYYAPKLKQILSAELAEY